jgi:hypothetical protein
VKLKLLELEGAPTAGLFAPQAKGDRRQN